MRKFNIKRFSAIPLIFILVTGATPAFAGPVIIDGTDSPDHPQNWPYVENAAKSLLEQETRPGVFTSDILSLGTFDTGSGGGGVINLAAANLGVTVQHCPDVGGMEACFAGLQDGTINVRMLYFPGTGSPNDLDDDEGDVLTANAQLISDFVASGGGVLSHGRGDTALGWLGVLLPGLEYPGGCENDGASRTAEGIALFPDITDENIQGVCHNTYSGDFGGLVVLALDGDGLPFILGLEGGAGGSIEEGVVDGPITEIECTYDGEPEIILTESVLDYTINGSCDIYRDDDVEMKNMTINVDKELTPVTNSVEYSDFTSISGIILNGDAKQSGTALRVVSAEDGQVGSAYLENKTNISQFNTQFQVEFSEPGGLADGLTFVIQNDGDGTAAIGGGGGSLGYTGISPSVATSFDIWVNGGCDAAKNISILANGDQCTKLAETEFNFVGDQIYNVWIDYDGTTQDVFISTNQTKPNLPIVSHNIDIPSILGSDTAYVGFTAATGGANANHDILNWSFSQKSNAYTQTGAFTIIFDDESGSIIVNENGDLSKDGNQVQFTGSISGVLDGEFEPVPQCGDVDANITLGGDIFENNSIRTQTIPSSSASGSVSINNQCPVEPRTSSGGMNHWDTRPTFGISHEDRANQVVENGFRFNNNEYMLTDNHHTDFAEQEVEIGTMNSFSATVYADGILKVQEFLFGIPNVGEAHLAELGVEVWYDRDGNIDDVIVVQQSEVIDADTVSVSHEKVKCLSTDAEAVCDTTTVSMMFKETLKDKVMAIKAIDYDRRDHRTFLNEGFTISGESLNPMLAKMIPSNERNQGLLKVTQVAKYSPYWSAEDGRMFEMNSFGSFKQINKSFERFQDTGNAFTRQHSAFGGILDYEQNRATNLFDSSKLVSELPESFTYIYPETGERITDEMLKEMELQAEIAQRVLDEMDKQNRHY